MSLNTLKLIGDCDIIAAHVFPFSPRPTTPAARMPQVGSQAVKSRAARLRAEAADQRAKWLRSLVGTIQPALIEGPGKGHTDNFAPIALAGAERGQSGKVRITGHDGDQLMAVWA